ncbi:MAG: asparagine synthase (glutamine-hydrolyzing) [Roseivirga sp.]|nr:asparagine synthase (glutamine-hydrolyzing) [Roseivirga sp.]
MCGINGLFNTNRVVLKCRLADQVKQMNSAIPHRGPDDEGVWESPDHAIALGHQRLSILDLSSQGHQPMLSDDQRYTISFNGEIYNFPQLKQQYLSEEQFHSNTDTEVILKLYRKFGKKVPSMLNGMFAFAVWDHDKKELFLTRDRSGKKPLYYTHQNGVFAFSSEIKALLSLDMIGTGLDHEAFYHFLTFSKVPAPFTCFEQIEKFEPASYMLINASGIQEYETFWKPEYENLESGSFDQLKERIFDNLKGAVNNRMLSDVPLGAFLSGGVDSSAVVALMREKSSESIDTFSIGFEDQPRYDELKHASHVSELFGTQHHEKIVNKNDLLSFISTIVDIFDEPLSDTTCIPIYFLSEMAKAEGIKVVLTGDGADEIFAGYRNFVKYDGYVKHARKFNRLPTPIKKLGAGAYGIFNASSPAYDILNRLSKDQEMIWVGANGFKEVTKRKLLGKAFDRPGRNYDSYEVVKKFKRDFDQINAPRSLNHIDWMCYMGYRFAVTDQYLFRADRLGMKHSIEIRSPFLDYHLISLALSIPSNQKIKEGEPKYILKKALEPILSKEILYRKKQGFNVPLREWASDTLTDFIETHLDSFCNDTGLFDKGTVRTQLKKLNAGQKNYTNNIWTVFFVMNWFNKWFR